MDPNPGTFVCTTGIFKTKLSPQLLYVPFIGMIMNMENEHPHAIVRTFFGIIPQLFDSLNSIYPCRKPEVWKMASVGANCISPSTNLIVHGVWVLCEKVCIWLDSVPNYQICKKKKKTTLKATTKHSFDDIKIAQPTWPFRSLSAILRYLVFRHRILQPR